MSVFIKQGMSMFIKLVENRPPKEYAELAAADISYDDITEGESPATYEYDLLPSGALRILRVTKGEAAVVDSIYAPGLWFRVQGQCRGNAE